MSTGDGSDARARFDAHDILRLLLLGLCVYFAVHGVGTALKPYGSDFTIYWKAGRAVLEGQDPYDVFGFIYLPIFAVAMAPFALLPQSAAIVAWQVVSFAALLYLLRASVRLLAREGLPTPRRLDWLPLLFVLRLVDSNFANGQVNLIVFALVMLGAESWRSTQAPPAVSSPGAARADSPHSPNSPDSSNSPGSLHSPDSPDSHEPHAPMRSVGLAGVADSVAPPSRARLRLVLAGAWFGVATALKIVPGFFVVHGVLRGAWRSIVAALLVGACAVMLAPVPFLGWSGNVDGLRRWWHETSAPYVHGGQELLDAREYLPGQSLTATTYRLLSKTPSTSLGEDGPSAEIADLPLATTRWIVRGLQALVLATIVASILRSRSAARPGAWTREFALTTCGALLLAPLVHKAHMCWLVLPVTLLVSGAPVDLGRAKRSARWAFVGAAFALIALTTPTLFGRQLASTFLSHNAIFFGLVCLFVALLIDVWGASRSTAEAPPARDQRARTSI